MVITEKSDGYITIGFYRGKVNEVRFGDMSRNYKIYLKNNKVNEKLIKKLLQKAVDWVEAWEEEK